MKKSLNLILEDESSIEQMRSLVDNEAEGALVFLRRHFKGKARDLLIVQGRGGLRNRLFAHDWLSGGLPSGGELCLSYTEFIGRRYTH